MRRPDALLPEPESVCTKSVFPVCEIMDGCLRQTLSVATGELSVLQFARSRLPLLRPERVATFFRHVAGNRVGRRAASPAWAAHASPTQQIQSIIAENAAPFSATPRPPWFMERGNAGDCALRRCDRAALRVELGQLHESRRGFRQSMCTLSGRVALAARGCSNNPSHTLEWALF